MIFDVIDVLRLMFRRKLHKPERRRFLLVLPTPQSKSTPLGCVGFRVVNPDASLEMGIERAKATKCYSPRVEVEDDQCH